MNLSNIKDLCQQALSRNEVIVFFCSCTLTYSGRAQAFVPQGDRMIIIKSDNVLLVHQPENGTPINYLKSGASFQFHITQGRLLIHAQSDKDYLDIEVFNVYDYMSRRLEDGQKQILEGNERDMSDMIKDNPSLIADDFIPLSREEHTKFGFIDVFGHDGKGNVVIVECKRYTASLACVTQLRRYVEKISELKGITAVKGVMASPAISANALSMLQQWGFSHVVVHPPKRLERYKKDQKSLLSF